MKNRTIAIGSDHAGYKYKCEVITYLLSKGFNVLDVGCDSLESTHYPIYGKKVGELVSEGKAFMGIVICSSGEGIMMAANKVKGVRAGLVYNDDVARLLKEHNDANVLAFGANFMSLDDIKKRIDIYLNSEFLGGRHETRKNMIEN